MTQIEEIKKLIGEVTPAGENLAMEIWNFAETAYQEVHSSEVLIQALKNQGFAIQEKIASIPTAFSATAKVGSGKPVMAILAEYDALGGLSQKAASADYAPVIPGGPGHGSAHNLLGAGCYMAAVALKKYLENHSMDGTVILFGCPAEDGAGAKQYIARAGLFDQVDFAYTWQPSTLNQVPSEGSVAIMGANFVFDGISSNAGAAPHLGRSALDACELMNIGVNYLREHMIDEARVNYAYSDAGGTAPNVVQSHACIKYEVRAPKVNQMQELFARVVDIAKGAALMTGTTMRYDITMAFSDYQANKTLAPVMQEALTELGTPEWTEEDYKLAYEMLHTYNKAMQKEIRQDLMEKFDTAEMDELLEKPMDNTVHPFDLKNAGYKSRSTDVGDVCYATPTVMLNVATAGLGTADSSWQNTAFAGSKTGMKGMIRASEILTYAFIKTLEQPELIKKAKEEVLQKNGGKYICPLPDYVQPPIGTY